MQAIPLMQSCAHSNGRHIKRREHDFAGFSPTAALPRALPKALDEDSIVIVMCTPSTRTNDMRIVISCGYGCPVEVAWIRDLQSVVVYVRAS